MKKLNTKSQNIAPGIQPHGPSAHKSITLNFLEILSMFEEVSSINIEVVSYERGGGSKK